MTDSGFDLPLSVFNDQRVPDRPHTLDDGPDAPTECADCGATLRNAQEELDECCKPCMEFRAIDRASGDARFEAGRLED